MEQIANLAMCSEGKSAAIRHIKVLFISSIIKRREEKIRKKLQIVQTTHYDF